MKLNNVTKISFYTLGCKLNQAETDELKKNLIKMGFVIVPFGSSEDITIIRACGVTCNASRTVREVIRRVKRQGVYVIATGCLENKDLKEIDFVGKDNEEILCHCEERRKSDEAIPLDLDNGNLNLMETLHPIYRGPRDGINRTRAFIKIQTGCNFKCAYCIIPSFRGKSQSIPTKEILKKINETIKDGCKEIVLTGINICLYKHKTYDLAGLLTEILKKTKIERIRLGSLDPRLISDKLLKLYCHPFTSFKAGSEGAIATEESLDNMTTPKRDSSLSLRMTNSGFNIQTRLMPHWHLSLQSGSDSVLKRMARGYTTKQYLKIVNKLRKHNPLFSFTTDIIVGFPGETEKEFKETCEFVKKVGFTKIHIFPFSPRPGTPAAKLKPVTNYIVTERVKKLTKIAEQIAGDYEKKFIGLIRPVLFENKRHTYFDGYTPEYVRVKYVSGKKLEKKIINLKIKKKDFF